MATSFKLPSLASKQKPRLQFPEFEWADVSIKEEVGNGMFGSVYIVKYKKEDRNVVVKKMKGESMETKRRFVLRWRCGKFKSIWLCYYKAYEDDYKA